LRESIVADASISDGVSIAVREMYEEHPYPRWFAIDRIEPVPLRDWIDREAPMAAAHANFPAGAKVLVAGCGTGHEAIELAAGLSDTPVLAVDLSRTSLAYASRMADELGVGNIEFRHGDILGLGALTERFAMIYCNGVLHHLHDPHAGLRVLVQLLQPGGLLRLSLYSERARTGVTAARAIIREREISPTASSIREFRQMVLQQGRDSALAPLCRFLDFYSMSMCRDLMFHVQEHQMRLPQIAAMLQECGLTMRGFTNVPPKALGAYGRAHPDDPQMTDFSKWDAIEAQHPETFDEMYQFWCTRN
jgi:SAM-dependent methyltransferase